MQTEFGNHYGLESCGGLTHYILQYKFGCNLRMLCPFQRFSSFFSHRDHLQTLFDKAEVAFDVDSDLDRARLVTAQIRYYENLKKKLVERETEFGMIR